MEYFVYIIRSKSKGIFYTGMTNNIERRLRQHNGRHSITLRTSRFSDFELVSCQNVDNISEARKLEKFLKLGYGREIRDEIVKYAYTLGV